MELKFKGKYGELKGKGYEFQKLFAGNYMQWCKTIGGKWGNTIRVWKRGAEVGLNDFHETSGVVAEYVRDNEMNYRDIFSKEMSGWRMVVNMKEGTVGEYVIGRHYDVLYFLRDEGGSDWERVKENVDLIPGITHREFCKTYRVVIITEEYGEAIRNLFTEELVELA